MTMSNQPTRTCEWPRCDRPAAVEWQSWMFSEAPSEWYCREHAEDRTAAMRNEILRSWECPEPEHMA